MRKRILGAEHPDTLMAMGLWPIWQLHSGTKESGRMLRSCQALEVQVLDMTKRILGAEHPDTLMAMANLAATFQSQEKWKDAEELNVQSLDIRNRLT